MKRLFIILFSLSSLLYCNNGVFDKIAINGNWLVDAVTGDTIATIEWIKDTLNDYALTSVLVGYLEWSDTTNDIATKSNLDTMPHFSDLDTLQENIDNIDVDSSLYADSSGYADTAGYALQPCKLHVNISKDGNITSFNTLVTLTAYVNETGIIYNWDGGAGSNKTLITPITGNHNVVVSKSGCINDTAEIYIIDQTDFHENYNIELPPYSASDSLLSFNNFLNGTPVANQLAIFREDGKEIGGNPNFTYDGTDLLFENENMDMQFSGDGIYIDAFTKDLNKQVNFLFDTNAIMTIANTGVSNEVNTKIDTAKVSIMINSDSILRINENNIKLFKNTNITGIINLDDGADNIIIGDNSGTNITSAVDNTIIGDQAGAALTEGTDNTGVGQGALNLLQTGTYNTAVGWWSLYANISGNNNTAVGGSSLYNNTGHNNTALGSQSLYSNTSGAQNTACGILSLDDNLTGNNNLGLGYTAGRYGTNLSNRIYINTLSRTNLLGDTTLSPIYILQAAATAEQRLWLNANVYISDSLVGTKAYFDSIYTDLSAAWADIGLSKDYDYGNFWEDLNYALQNGHLITFKDKPKIIQDYLRVLALTQERTIRQMADELKKRDKEITRLEKKIDRIQLFRNEKMLFIFIALLAIWCIALTLKKL